MNMPEPERAAPFAPVATESTVQAVVTDALRSARENGFDLDSLSDREVAGDMIESIGDPLKNLNEVEVAVNLARNSSEILQVTEGYRVFKRSALGRRWTTGSLVTMKDGSLWFHPYSGAAPKKLS